MTDFSNFDWFRDDGIFLPMINDGGRNQFYKQALDRAAPGKVVVDVGAGTGLLSLLALKAGAKHVFAVEQDNNRAEYLRQMVEHLGVGNNLTVIHNDFLKTQVAGDIYVSETINTQIFGEDILNLSAHAHSLGGSFIPAQFEITPTLYKQHPIFTLDQTHSDFYDFDPQIEIDKKYIAKIKEDFRHRHSISSTLYTCNQLNKLFQLLPRFNDVKLEKLYQGQPLVIDLNRKNNVDDIKLSIPSEFVPKDKEVCMVLFWKAKYQDVVMDCKNVWFGNVSKIIPPKLRQPNADIETWYDEQQRNWRVIF